MREAGKPSRTFTTVPHSFMKSFAIAPTRGACMRVRRVCLLSLLAAGPAGAQSPGPAAASLPPVVVTATRFPDDPATLPFGVSVITADEIRDAGIATVNEALMKLLGVPGRVDLNGGGDYTLDLRGFGATSDANQVVVVDGLRVSEADLGGTRLAGIPIDSVERIEVLRGGGAVLYGEGATGGVIVVTTRGGRAGARASRGDVYAAAGSYGLREVRAGGTLAGGGLGGFSLDANLSKRDADNHRDNFRSRTDAASLAAQWRGDGVRLGVRHAEDRLDTGLPGALTAAQYDADPRQASTPDDRGSIRNRRSGVFAEATVGGWQLGVDAGVRSKALRSTLSGFDYDYDVKARNQSLRARHAARLDGGAANALILGFDHDRWTREVLGAFGSTASQASRAFYVNDDFTFAAGTRLSAGLRSERFDKESSAATAAVESRQRAWQLGAVQPIGAGAAVYARLGRSFRLPNVDEFTFASPGAALRPQQSRDVEAGLRWAPSGGRAELRFYRHALTDEIGFDPAAPGPFGAGANVNFDPTRRQGVELELAQALGAGVGVRVNAALRQSRFTAGAYEGREVPLTSRRTLAVRLDWALGGGHRLDAGVAAASAQHPDYANACAIPGRALVDARYAWRTANAELAFGVANLAGRRYYTQAFGCVAGTTTSIYPEAGRAFTASARLFF